MTSLSYREECRIAMAKDPTARRFTSATPCNQCSKLERYINPNHPSCVFCLSPQGRALLDRNKAHPSQRKLTKEQIEEIVHMRNVLGMALKDIAPLFGVHKTTIQRMVSRGSVERYSSKYPVTDQKQAEAYDFLNSVIKPQGCQ